MKSNVLVGLAVSVALSACVSAQPRKEPPAVAMASTRAAVTHRLPTTFEKYSATDLGGTYYGASGAQGSAVAGVAFGLIGVMGNIAYINARNRENAAPLSLLTSLNLADVLRKQVPGLDGAVASGYELVPSANVLFTDKTAYWTTCTITAHQPGTKWQARYSVLLDGHRQSGNAEDTQSAKAAMPACLKSAYTLFSEHVDGKLMGFESRTVTSPKLDGTGNLDQLLMLAPSAMPDRLIMQDGLGLVQLRKSQVVAIK